MARNLRFGRGEELSALLRVCLEGKSGIGASVLIYGPPNIGKTSLLLKLKSELQSMPETSAPPRPFPVHYSFSEILAHRRYSEKGDGLSALATGFSSPFASKRIARDRAFETPVWHPNIKLQNIS